MTRAGPITKALLLLAAIGVAGAWWFIGVLWLERGTEITLPAPTGTFGVGRSIYDWRDRSSNHERELLVWMWYPTDARSGAIAEYMPAAMRKAAEDSTGLLFRLVTKDLSKVHVHSIRDAAVSSVEQSYPVLLMRGGSSLPAATYSVLAEDLASHGYVVVGLDAPGRTKTVVFPDGRVERRTSENNVETCGDKTSQSACVNVPLTAWTADMAFAVDQLEGLNESDVSGKFTQRLDMSKLGVFGHSFGGAQAAQFCHDDPRCKAGIDIDGLLFGSVVAEGLHQPFMFLLGAQVESYGPESRMFKAEMQSIYDRLPRNRRVSVEIRGSNHFLFSDDGAFLKSHFVMRGLRALGMIGMDGPRQMDDTAWLVRTFFDDSLKHGMSRLQIPSPLYPEIRVLD